eukprot:13600703-Ditylum_brightwellii.AAC.1
MESKLLWQICRGATHLEGQSQNVCTLEYQGRIFQRLQAWREPCECKPDIWGEESKVFSLPQQGERRLKVQVGT